MIARRGVSTRAPGARPCAGLAGAAPPIRRRQRGGDPGAAPRGRSTTTPHPPPEVDRGRPRVPHRVEQAVARAAAPVAAGVAQNPAALARRPRRSPLDLPETTRPTGRPGHRPVPWCCGWPGRTPPWATDDPWRAGRTRPRGGRLDRLDDPQRRRPRSRTTAVRPVLATVPHRAGPRDPGRRLRPRRHGLPDLVQASTSRTSGANSLVSVNSSSHDTGWTARRWVKDHFRSRPFPRAAGQVSQPG